MEQGYAVCEAVHSHESVWNLSNKVESEGGSEQEGKGVGHVLPLPRQKKPWGADRALFDPNRNPNPIINNFLSFTDSDNHNANVRSPNSRPC
jgi:hypothetical protein